ncbi:MAG: isoprenyl transferase [Planctomycetes bacterium]|nr:isoprenyl transferase [Planctomycetota bacterium]HPF15513.1 isoprenyl transferase [Planctomycetota bacterium]HRV80636.1 isoprenyl transferase [Planctomycetota bacterium]
MQHPEFPDPLPEHVAIIMDGNGRWATERGMPRVRGHVAGVQSVREVTTECARLGIGSLTLYAFSVENWKRPSTEVRYLMRLLRVFLRRELATLMENGVRLRCIGRLQDLPAVVQSELQRTEERTRSNTGMVLRLALSYGGRSEIADALKAFGADVQAGRIDPSRVDEETLRAYLYDPETPDPDLIIRTAGEMRLSNFLLWQLSYAELFVSSIGWPEFKRAALHEAFRSFGSRHRKFGMVPEKASGPKERA